MTAARFCADSAPTCGDHLRPHTSCVCPRSSAVVRACRRGARASRVTLGDSERGRGREKEGERERKREREGEREQEGKRERGGGLDEIRITRCVCERVRESQEKGEFACGEREGEREE